MLVNTIITSLLLISTFNNDNHNYPNLVGASGGLRTFSAQMNEPTTFGLNIAGGFFNHSPFIDSQKFSRSHLRFSGNFSFKFLLPWEVFAGTVFRFSENSNIAAARTTTTFFENIDTGLRTGLSMFEDKFHIGGYGFLRLFSGTRSFRNSSGALRTQQGPILNAELGGAATFDFSKAWKGFPFRSHLNVAYRSPNGNLEGTTTDDFNKMALDSFKYQMLLFRGGAELIWRYAAPFIEYYHEYAFATGSTSVDYKDNRQKLTIGARITPFTAFNVLLAADIGINGPDTGSVVGIPRNPIWEAHGALQLQLLPKHVGILKRNISGMVTDLATGLPIDSVKVTVVGPVEPYPRKTGITGLYEATSLPPGDYQLTFEKGGYNPVYRSVKLTEDSDVILDVTMVAIGPKTGDLSLRIFDAETKEPIHNALVTIAGKNETYASDEAGDVEIKNLAIGNQEINVTAVGYIPHDFEVDIEEGALIKQDVYLHRIPPETGYCKGLVKNKDGTPLIAAFVPKTEGIEPFVSHPVTGGFDAKLPVGTHAFEVTADTYLPQTVECTVKPDETTELEIILLKPGKVTVTESEIVLSDSIYYAFDSDVIDRKSYGLLNEIAEIINSRTDLPEIQIEGHTDSTGSDAYNKDLSRRRALSVKRYLIKQGVDASRLNAVGFGEGRPISTNLTREGRAENRRVEFNIVDNGE